ncbi:helix-turn-helix domain-containing protein [uncultured Sphingomonas sp.]|uniref:helix-turn-helix domain-containing protein n=1 Tax=uncultured Sphingomonas sp. TaxID=158754 RepID=UPI0025E03E5A|nr:helix-turn-helix domain-containing protein [uncultured Sphingomonas sp.]
MADADTLLERRRLYDEGLADRAIARLQGVDRTTIRYWRRRNDLPINPPPPRPTRLETSHEPDEETRRQEEQAKLLDAARSALWRQLYDDGLADGAIAKGIGGTTMQVLRWRRRENLPPNFPRFRNACANPALVFVTPDLKRRALALFERGIGSRIIAREMKASVQTLDRWRTEMLRAKPELRRRSTAGRRTPRHANGTVYSKLRPDRRARAFVLYADGKNDREIADELGIYAQQVWEWRTALFLPPIGKAGRRATAKPKPHPTGPAITPMSNPLYAELFSAVGRGLSPDLTDDAVSDMWLAIAEGRLLPCDVRKLAGRFRNKVVATYASRFGPRSLDEEIGDGDGLRMIDMLKDDSSSNWLEEMGATVW